jgi:hypothetical protein
LTFPPSFHRRGTVDRSAPSRRSHGTFGTGNSIPVDLPSMQLTFSIGVVSRIAFSAPFHRRLEQTKVFQCLRSPTFDSYHEYFPFRTELLEAKLISSSPIRAVYVKILPTWGMGLPGNIQAPFQTLSSHSGRGISSDLRRRPRISHSLPRECRSVSSLWSIPPKDA